MSVWDTVVGQGDALDPLIAAVDGDRAMTHAWLITGPPGFGRSIAARAFAAALQCEKGGCGECHACRTVVAGAHPDVRIVATEKVTITVDEVRSLVSHAQSTPSQGRWRVIIIEDADRMTERTSNVLLKAVEEPPPRTAWILCAPSLHDVATTIRSRCRVVTLRIPSVEVVTRLLVERDGVEPELAAVADDEAKSATVERDAAEVAELYLTLGVEPGERLPPALRSQVRQLEEDQKRRATRARRDVLDRALLDLLSLYRDVANVQTGSDVAHINESQRDRIGALAGRASATDTLAMMDAIGVARERLAGNVAPVLALEAMLVALRPRAA